MARTWAEPSQSLPSVKLLATQPSKILGPMSMGTTLETLGLRLMLVEDTAATARTAKFREPVISSHQRFDNKSASKASDTVQIDAPPPDPAFAFAAPISPPLAPASRSHLRVVQNKSGSRFG
jgi:hypothetical protein